MGGKQKAVVLLKTVEVARKNNIYNPPRLAKAVTFSGVPNKIMAGRHIELQQLS